MINTTFYLLRDFFRSHRYFAPMFSYAGFVAWMYLVVPNPVLESYSTSATLLFAVTGWLTLNLLRTESPVQGQLTVLHAGSRIRYEAARLLAAFLLTAALSVLALLLPVLRGAFVHRPSGLELASGLYAHLSLSLVMILLVWLMSFTGRNYLDILLSLIFVLAASLGGKGIEQWLPQVLRPVAWLIPPVFRVNDALFNQPTYSTPHYLGLLAVPALYALILAAAGFWRLGRRPHS